MTCEKILLLCLENDKIYKQEEMEVLVQKKCLELEIETKKDVQREVRRLYKKGKYFDRIKNGFYLFNKDFEVKKDTGTYFSADVKNKIFERDGNVCQLCGFEFPKDQLLIDHIIAYDNNGLGEYNNGQVCCITCNNKKRNKDNLLVLKDNYQKHLMALKVLERNIGKNF